MEEFLTFLIRPLLSKPESLQISTNPGNISISVSPEDTGRVIGKHGQIINSLRTLFKAYCSLHNLPPTSLTLNAPPISKTDSRPDSH
ncbi:hypothetical protein A2634_03635 [Candidatus Amesbacteria bacterium RIFCSPHIGHO2_01_FULL_48_32]|uniref:RNA-binding protein n=1 Tax=Candidatus Amesbacteria bacterium RIFCSPLOWO2_01_FULL_48_25 TaxID=1797259 RepID=A0A1F4ZBT3_9BACT|nr:MAG: hypothetical protein A2634_03635 [Candidatus Amesbacteria bacterium RIFCSPHIGHO2_01_FULL_48_32]OGD03770.1 MAG: hypothetical protein A2989_03755 [Candidatus Amesbacteria bacterium RIFCSPLOWO2_01_FULL_48_25]